MEDALCSILCGERQWSHKIPWWVSITFNKDGTGELCAIGDIGVFILSCNLTWKSIRSVEPATSNAEVSAIIPSLWAAKPQLLGTLHLEITLDKSLTKRWAESMPTSRYKNETNFTDLAFQTRSFKVMIEKGNFMSEASIGTGQDPQRYGLRLTFDESPYPPIEAFRNPTQFGRDLSWWATELHATSTFLGRNLPDTTKKTKAMNDDSGSRIGCEIS